MLENHVRSTRSPSPWATHRRCMCELPWTKTRQSTGTCCGLGSLAACLDKSRLGQPTGKAVATIAVTARRRRRERAVTTADGRRHRTTVTGRRHRGHAVTTTVATFGQWAFTLATFRAHILGTLTGFVTIMFAKWIIMPFFLPVCGAWSPAGIPRIAVANTVRLNNGRWCAGTSVAFLTHIHGAEVVQAIMFAPICVICCIGVACAPTGIPAGWSNTTHERCGWTV